MIKIIYISATFFLLSFSLYATDNNKPLDRIIVKIKNGETLPHNKFIKKINNLFENLYYISTNDSTKLLKELKNNPAIEYVELDKKTVPSKLPTPKNEYNRSISREDDFFNDPKAGKIWSFRDARRKGISITKTYSEFGQSTGNEIIVAVVDTGVDYTHPDLKDSIWTNEDEIPGNGIDDDNNGYIDDIHGINTLIRDSNGDATVDIMDGHSHGTHVSGTIGATQNNNLGIAGIASKVKIMGIRTVPNNADEKDVDIIEAFLYAAKNGAKIINCSFGKRVNEGGMAVNETIDYIGKKYGVLVVVAAGNSSANIDKRPAYPASFPSDYLLVVASTTSIGSYSYFTNYGIKNVDLAAPGSSIYSTIPNGKYGNMSGTSMASPTTAGVAAEVLSRFPDLGPLELKKALMDSVTNLKRRSQKVKSGGRVDLYNTITNLMLK